MALIVQKYGGTSVADLDKIRTVADRIAKTQKADHRVVVVVSAMAGVTNQLVGYANQIMPDYDTAEYSSLVAAGEQVSSALLAMTLQSKGLKARSFLGWQIPVETNNAMDKARIENIKSVALKKCLKDGIIPIIAGFQGIEPKSHRITTLGRGGSDTSAVAVAAALKADYCDIYTDVDGVYTCDPKLVPEAKRLTEVSYEEMLEMASLGAKVLQTRSVEMGMKYKVPIRVLSTFSDKEDGTLILKEEDIMEKEVVSCITYDKNQARISLSGLNTGTDALSKIFKNLADANINIDMIVQNAESKDRINLTFTIEDTDFTKAKKTLTALKEEVPYDQLIENRKIVKVSVIGIGMRSHANVAGTMFSALEKQNIEILAVSTSEIKISVLIDSDYLELALRVLHTAFGLDKKK